MRRADNFIRDVCWLFSPKKCWFLVGSLIAKSTRIQNVGFKIRNTSLTIYDTECGFQN